MTTPVNTSILLKSKGIRPSVQRIAVMNYLLANHTHPTAAEIYGALAEEIPTLSKTTVYNTLLLLATHGAVTHITIDPHVSRFDADTSAHGHFLCTSCDQLYDVFFDSPPTLPPVGQGHTVHQAQIYYNGVCKRCLNKQ